MQSFYYRKTVGLIVFTVLLLGAGSTVTAQVTRHVLFLGNSYTGVNNLPQMIQDAALSAGDTLIYDSYTPGGYQLVDHYQDPVSLAKIQSGGWEYVVLQGQSQEPITYSSDFNNGGHALHDQIKQYNPCAVTKTYMTWGRKNGDAANCPFFPVMCTYEGMDTTLRDRYLALTESLNGEVSPVSVVWKYLRQNHPAIELYQADESHPSAEGSYAAACSFYAAIFKKDPTLITFNSGINATDASVIRDAAKLCVYDSLSVWDFKKAPVADFGYQITSGINEISFNAISHGVRQTYFWDFGDGTTSTDSHPTHSYASDGMYTVSLTTTTCDLQGMHTSFTDTVIEFCSHTPAVYTVNPWLCTYDTLWTQTADAYQWYWQGIALPETSQYLPNYFQYGYNQFSVLSTVNGCSEMSAPFMDTPVWSGFYGDAIGDPCTGDTVAFAVLSINGLSGNESILWYKNDTLLPAFTNEDTLWITGSGKYESKIIDPASVCPSDTTSLIVEYNCSASSIEEMNDELFLSVYPNPASEIITLQFSKLPKQEKVFIYNATGQLMKVIEAMQTMQVSVSDLPDGLYLIRLEKQSAVVKFMKK